MPKNPRPRRELIDFFLWLLDPLVEYFGQYGVHNTTVVASVCLIIVIVCLIIEIKKKQRRLGIIALMVFVIFMYIYAIIEFQFFVDLS
jgi:hypothetical protein